jgi:hypothetical protein
LKNISNNKWVIGFLIVVICLLFQVGSAVNAADLKFSYSPLSGFSEPQNLLQVQTPESGIQMLPAEEQDRFIEVAQVFTHPHSRNDMLDAGLAARALIEYPLDYDGDHIRLNGKIINIWIVENLLPTGWPTAYVIVIDDGTAWLPVLYRGSVANFNIGDLLNVQGVYIGSRQAVHADVVYVEIGQYDWLSRLPVEIPFDVPQGLPIGLIIASIGLIFLGVLAVFVGISRRLLTFLVIPLIILIGLTSCEIHIEYIVRTDGSVSVGTKVGESIENIDFLRDIPGMQRYLLSWLDHLREEGIVVDNLIVGEKEYFFLQYRYPDLESFSTLELDKNDSTEADTWVYATTYQRATADCFRYIASINPQSLYTTPPNTEQAIIREMNKQIDQIDFTYNVSLPGQIIYSNTELRTGNRLEWKMAMNQSHQVVAESCLHRHGGVIPDWTWAWVGVGGLGMVDVGLWIWAFRRRKHHS